MAGKSPKSFTDQIRCAVDASGMARAEVARGVGIAPSAITKFMKGQQWFGAPKLDALAELLGLRVTTLDTPRSRRR